MIYGALLILILTQALAAPVCGTQNKTVSLKISQTFDQDGLNTCGANALSHTIQSVLKTPKRISYLDVAIQGAKKEFRGRFVGEERRMAFEGTESVCDTLESIKANGGVCPQENFSFENSVYSNWGGNDPGSKQKNLLLALSQFLDHAYAHVKRPETRQAELAKILNFVTEKKLTFSDKCAANGNGKADVDFHQTFQGLMGKLMLWVSANKTNPAQKACVAASTKYFNSFVTTPLGRADQHPLDIRPEVKAKFKKSYLSELLFKEWKQGLNPPGDKFSLPLAKFIDENSNFMSTTCQLKSETSDHPLSGKKLYQVELTNSVVKELKAALNTQECEKKALADWLNSKKAVSEVSLICPDEGDVKDILNAMSVMPLWSQDVAQILPRLVPGKTPGLDDLTHILAPDCEKNRLSLGHMRCEEFSTMVRIQALPLEEIRSQFREVTMPQLDLGRAVPVGICSSFLAGDTSDTRETCEYNQTGHHAVPVTGYRCVAGKIEYEITNSWGADCPVKKGGKDKVIECVMDAKGWPTGRFWVKEDHLLNNLYKYYKVTP